MWALTTKESEIRGVTIVGQEIGMASVSDFVAAADMQILFNWREEGIYHRCKENL